MTIIFQFTLKEIQFIMKEVLSPVWRGISFCLFLNLCAGAQITFYKEYPYGGNVILQDDGYMSFTSAEVNGSYMLRGIN